MNSVYRSLEIQQSRFPRLTFRSLVAMWAVVLIILSFSLYIGIQHAASNQLQAAAAGSDPATIKSTGNTTPTLQSTGSMPAHAVATCTPYKGGTVPSALSLGNSPDGLTTRVDSPNLYQIYGNTAASIRAQIQQCAPPSNDASGGLFTAQTIYQVTWQYSYVSTSEGLCKVVHAKVGMHVMQIMPLWRPTTAAQAGLSSQWQSFMTALTTHENGHTALDTQYAQTLVDDLTSFPATACSQLAQSITHLTDGDVAALNEANNNYDSRTNHGATQGAILPQ